MSDLEESDEENYEENNYVERYEIDREDLENYIAAFLDEATLEYLQRLKLTVNAPPDAPIDEAALMDRPTATGSTLMSAAAAANDVTFMQILLRAGASVSVVRTFDGFSPMTCAILGGATEAVALLLDQGVSIDRLDEMPDTTPLWLAVEKRHEELALLLVERGANLERIVEPTFNVLTFAVTRQMVRLARRIAELEPRLIAQQMACNCDLLIGSCANSAFLPLTEHILANFSPDLSARASGASPPLPALYVAVQCHSLAHVELLLAHGAPVDQRTSKHGALHAAVNGGHLEIVERLLAHGATVEPAKRWDSYTPLMLAVRQGYVAVARRLVEAGADTKVLLPTGDTLLHLAAMSGNADMVRFVLPFCNVAQADHSGVTAGLWACNDKSSEYDEVLDVLLAAGAKLDTVDDAGWSPFTSLAANGRLDAVKRLVERGAISVHFAVDGTNLVYYAAERGHVEMLRWLLEQRVALDMPSTAGTTQVGETPLFVAAETGRLDTLRVLADAGANLRHATVSGDTPLRAAARNGHGDCVRFLLRRGVEPRRIDIEECVKLAKDPSALIALLAHGCAVDAALFALTEQSTTFMLLWHAGISRDDMSRMPHITALMRICGAMPPIECSLGEHCRDESELHKQLFFHERQRDEEEIVTTTMIQFIDSLPQKGLALVNDRAVQVLFGLQPLHLPALVSTIIIDCACPLATLLPMHLKWRLVTLIKHFEKSTAPTT